jgi:hypothetical protein
VCGDDTWEAEPNSLFETANGPLAADLTYCGYLGDTYDFYYMDFAAPGRLTVALQNVTTESGAPPLNLLKLFTAERVPIDWCCYSRQERIELAIDVHFGRYYIVVDNRELVGIPYMLLARYEPGSP